MSALHARSGCRTDLVYATGGPACRIRVFPKLQARALAPALHASDDGPAAGGARGPRMAVCCVVSGALAPVAFTTLVRNLANSEFPALDVEGAAALCHLLGAGGQLNSASNEAGRPAALFVSLGASTLTAQPLTRQAKQTISVAIGMAIS